MSKAARLAWLIFGFPVFGCGAATFTVTNAADSGNGTLRAAISSANVAGAGTHLIAFNLAAPYTVNLVSALPALTNSAMVNGATQPGYAGSPLVRLNGILTPSAAGLTFQAPGGGAQALQFTGFTNGIGVVLDGVSNRLWGCWSLSNLWGAAAGTFSSNAAIGGLASSNRNVLSANAQYGLYLGGSGNHLVQGNYLGLAPDGLHDLGNSLYGIYCVASDTMIGGSAPGSRNVISGNNQIGLHILMATRTQAAGNFVGTDATGTNAIPNGAAGISLSNCRSNTVGGATPAHGNVVAGNLGSGIYVDDKAAYHLFENNLVGLATNWLALPNGDTFVEAGLLIIGGYNTVAYNVVSGNDNHGLYLSGTNCRGNSVHGNMVGVDPSGTQVRPNQGSGVYISEGASANFIHAAPIRNTISGNQDEGVHVQVGSASNVIAGNFIGTDFAGKVAISNNQGGVSIFGAVGTTISGNLICGNRFSGIAISGGGSRDTVVDGNYVGVDVTGTNALPNLGIGVFLAGGSGHRVGSGGRNIISGNAQAGVSLTAALTNVLIAGNYVGVATNGAQALPNHHGIVLLNVVGRHLFISNNVISGNIGQGVWIQGGEATNQCIGGNLIGLAAGGLAAISNSASGIYLLETDHVRIGGPSAGDRNLISGNGSHAILLEDSGSNGTLVIAGNYIGLDKFGMDGPGNGGNGIEASRSPNVQVGGPTAAWKNLFCRNATGILSGQNGHNWWIANNHIGVEVTGFTARSNRASGVGIYSHAYSNVIENNLISGNAGHGIWLETNVRGTRVRANRIGVGAAPNFPLPNGGDGIQIYDAGDNLLGGTDPADANIIAYNRASGISVNGITPAWRTGNRILGNLIYSNLAEAIDLGNDGPTVNDNAPDADTGPNEFQNHPVLQYASHGGTNLSGRMVGSNATYRMEFFALTPAAGMLFVGAADHYNPPGGTGAFSFVFATPVPAGSLLLATATSGEGTSELSPALAMFDPDDTDGDGMPDWWEIANGLNEGVPNDADDDQDLDGVPDIGEWLADTLADDSHSYLHIVHLSNGVPRRIYVPTSAGRRYALESAGSLTVPAWTAIQDDVPGNGTLLDLSDAAVDTQSVYRVTARLPAD